MMSRQDGQVDSKCERLCTLHQELLPYMFFSSLLISSLKTRKSFSELTRTTGSCTCEKENLPLSAKSVLKRNTKQFISSWSVVPCILHFPDAASWDKSNGGNLLFKSNQMGRMSTCLSIEKLFFFEFFDFFWIFTLKEISHPKSSFDSSFLVNLYSEFPSWSKNENHSCPPSTR